MEYFPSVTCTPFAAPSTQETLTSVPHLSEVLDAMPHLVAVLDGNRNIVAANSQLLKHFGDESLDSLLGLSPGELLRCQTLSTGSAPCGSRSACKECGGNLAILESQSRKTRATMNCQITSGTQEEPLDLEITASHLRIQDQDFTVLSIVDMEDQNRRKVLERIFFHDVLNSAGGALGLAFGLSEADSIPEIQEYSNLMEGVLKNLIEEIQSQRDMLAAERGDLLVSLENIETTGLIQEVIHSLFEHQVAESRTLRLAPDAQRATIQSDRKLLFRVLVNLTKNALEATPTGGTVTLGFHAQGTEAVFTVHNPGVIPENVQLQIFRRSFSTKGRDRGIGTYSIKLLGERYLGGRVFFESEAESGTTFSIVLPHPLQADPDTPGGN